MHAHADIMTAIHAVDPYDGFSSSEHADLPLDLQGWGGDDPPLIAEMDRAAPMVAIEVGSWKGMSAVQIARRLRPGGTLVCVDTWLGANEFWADKDDPDRYRSLRLRHGYPTVYYQFMANVLALGLSDRIVPFPLPSVLAARHLARCGIRADLVYVDGSHEREDVAADLAAYFPLVLPGGVMIGDDYNSWPGVREAVDEFARDHQLALDWLDEPRRFWRFRAS